jgi:hypothetical protein
MGCNFSVNYELVPSIVTPPPLLLCHLCAHHLDQGELLALLDTSVHRRMLCTAVSLFTGPCHLALLFKLMLWCLYTRPTASMSSW